MNSLKYGLGVTLVGFGFCSLVGCVIIFITMFTEKDPPAVAAGVVSLFLTVFLLFVGMRLVRTAEKSNTEWNSYYEDSEDFFEQSDKHETSEELDVQSKFANFDLSRLNLWGWLLFLMTILFFGIEVLIIVVIIKVNLNTPGIKAYVAVAFILSLAFFGVTKFVMNKMGINIYNRR